MTDPPRGLIKPAILGALTGLALALAAIGTLERRTHPTPRPVCGGHPFSCCYPRCLP
jgi:hypothetical protein